MRLATMGADGYPQVTPVWYWFAHKTERFFISTEAHRTKFRNIQRDGRVGASIDDEAKPYRGLSIKGNATEVLRPDDELRQLVHHIIRRYFLPSEIDNALKWLFVGERVVIEIEPISVAKVGMGWQYI